MESVSDLVLRTVRDLRRVSNFSEGQNAIEYEQLVHQTVTNLVRLIGWDEKVYYRLTISLDPKINGVSLLNTVYYLNRASPRWQANRLASKDIIGYFQKYHQQAQNHTRLDKILKLIDHLGEQDHGRGLYNQILPKLSTFIEFLIAYNRACELNIIELLAGCFNYDLRYYSKVRHDWTNDVTEEDSAKIARVLDKIIDVESDHAGSALVPDYDYDIPLQFKSNNEDFTSMYNTLLKIATLKTIDIRDPSKYAELCLFIFKSHYNIQSLEIDSFPYKEKKFKAFLDLLVGDSGILPKSFEQINSSIINNWELFPESKKENDITKAIPPKNQPFPPKHISDPVVGNDLISKIGSTKQERQEILQHLKRILPLLNEYNLDFDVDFVAILKRYMSLLYDELPTVAVIADFNYIDQVVTLLNLVIDFENGKDETLNTNFKTTIDRIHELHKYLTRYVEIIPSTTVLMRIAVVEYYKRIAVQKIIIRQWSYKLATIEELSTDAVDKWVVVSTKRSLRKYLAQWYSHGRKLKDLETIAINYDNSVTLEKFFKKIDRARATRTKTIRKGDLHIIGPYFELWADKSLLLEGQIQRAVNFDKQLLFQKAFSNWNQNWQFQSNLNSIAKGRDVIRSRQEESKVLEIVWSQWYNKMVSKVQSHEKSDQDVETNRIRELGNLEKKYVLSKQFDKWTQLYCLESAGRRVKIENDRLLLVDKFQGKWLPKTSMIIKARNHRNSRDQGLKLSLFSMWKDLTQRRALAERLFKANNLRKFVKLWKLQSINGNTSSSNRLKKYEKSLQRNHFKTWRLNYKLRALNSKNSNKLMVEAFSKILSKAETINKNYDISETFKNDNSKIWAFEVWKQYLNMIAMDHSCADTFTEQRFFNHWKARFAAYEDLNQVQVSDSKVSFVDKFLLRVILKKWQQRFELRFDDNSNGVIMDFRMRYINHNLKLRMLHAWVENYNLSLVKQDALEYRERMFYEDNSSKAPFFYKWKETSYKHQDLTSQARSFDETVLKKKSLIVWYREYVNKSVYLEEIAAEYLDNSDFRQMQEILSNWSMRFMKMKRNQSSCDLFIKRWNVSRVRLLFDLWRWKVQEYVDTSFGDSEIIQNPSPLASRSSRVPSDKSVSYLFTPLKKQVSPRLPLATPGTTLRTSPTKLQETTQRLKNEKMNEVRRHYSRFRSSSTPKNSSVFDGESRTTESRYPILQPLTGSSILPPKPPNFSMQTSPQAQDHSAEDDTESIETAKTLRKITPIVFPADDDFQQPKFSPIKLRSRTNNRIPSANVNSTF